MRALIATVLACTTAAVAVWFAWSPGPPPEALAMGSVSRALLVPPIGDDITAAIGPAAARPDWPTAGEIDHPSFVDHYRRHLGTLAAQYPPGTFAPFVETIFGPYEGARSPSTPGVHRMPLALISPELSPRAAHRFERFRVEVDGRPIWGLRLVAAPGATPDHAGEPGRRPYAYMSDLAARAAGFTHGRLALPLCRGFEPRDDFDYNGPRDWSTHEILRRWDQARRPIALTNFTHDGGPPHAPSYVISAHPDFALRALPDVSERRLVFFLWRARDGGPKSDLRSDRPDFIYEIAFSDPLL